VLYKSKFSPSIKNAKQLITHKHIKVNDKIEKNGSYILKQGDLISVTFKAKNIIKENLKKQFQERPDAILWPIPPSYLNINYNTLEILFGDIENFNFTTSFNFKIDTNSIVTEYYRH
jgi:ribosomal protein S4